MPLRQADKSSGIDRRSNDPIVHHWRACLRKARTRPYEISEICVGHVTSSLEAHFPATAWTEAGAALEFGRFRVLVRQRQLVADGVPIDLGTRAFDLLLVLLEADGSLVAEDELLNRVWPGIVVADENLKVQISALRKALGDDHDLIRTEFGRGYRFTAVIRSTVSKGAGNCPRRPRHRSSQGLVPHWISRRSPHGSFVRGQARGRFEPAHAASAAFCPHWIDSAE
jgi:DNA-binding winged helix-turn-helix (wHTH) protein